MWLKRIPHLGSEVVAHPRKGSVALEIALVFPLLVLVVYISLELFLYFLSYAGLNYAAHTAADLASKLQIEIMTDSEVCPATGATVEKAKKCQEYIYRVSKIIEQADNLADKFSGRYPASGRVVRMPALHYYGAPQAQILGQEIPACAAASGCFVGFMRPGERVKFETSTRTIIAEHPTRAFTPNQADPNVPSGWPALGESWANILYTDPIVIQIEAEYYPLTPLIGPIHMSVRQLAYRKTPPIGRAARGPRPPTPTPSTPPSSSATSTATASPTPPDCSCCPSSCGADFAKCSLSEFQNGCFTGAGG